MTTTETPRVWIGSLAAYNSGVLLGDWFDAIDAPTTAEEWIDRLSDRGNERITRAFKGAVADDVRVRLAQTHEELWVFDHEGFSGLLKGECSPMHAQELAEFIEAVESDGYDVAAVAAWAENIGLDLEGKDWADVRDDFSEAYAGEHESERAYAEELAGELLAPGQDEFAARYFDYGAFTRDLFMGDMYSIRNPDTGDVHVFHNV